MTLTQQLENLINRYKVFLQDYSFKEVNEVKSGMGIVKDYDNEKLKLRFINDRGICIILVAKSQEEDNIEFYDIDLLRLLKLELENKLTEASINKSQRYSTDEDFEFVSSEYLYLVNLFTGEEASKTKQKIDDIKIKRV